MASGPYIPPFRFRRQGLLSSSGIPEDTSGPSVLPTGLNDATFVPDPQLGGGADYQGSQDNHRRSRRNRRRTRGRRTPGPNYDNEFFEQRHGQQSIANDNRDLSLVPQQQAADTSLHSNQESQYQDEQVDQPLMLAQPGNFANSPLYHRRDVDTYFWGVDGAQLTALGINNVLHDSANRIGDLSYILLFDGRNPRWEQDRIVFACADLELLPEYAEKKAEYGEWPVVDAASFKVPLDADTDVESAHGSTWSGQTATPNNAFGPVATPSHLYDPSILSARIPSSSADAGERSTSIDEFQRLNIGDQLFVRKDKNKKHKNKGKKQEHVNKKNKKGGKRRGKKTKKDKGKGVQIYPQGPRPYISPIDYAPYPSIVYPIAAFEQRYIGSDDLATSTGVDEGYYFVFAGWYTVSRICIVAPQSSELERLLEQRRGEQPRYDSSGKEIPDTMPPYSRAWEEAMEVEWAVVKFEELVDPFTPADPIIEIVDSDEFEEGVRELAVDRGIPYRGIPAGHLRMDNPEASTSAQHEKENGGSSMSSRYMMTMPIPTIVVTEEPDDSNFGGGMRVILEGTYGFMNRNNMVGEKPSRQPGDQQESEATKIETVSELEHGDIIEQAGDFSGCSDASSDDTYAYADTQNTVENTSATSLKPTEQLESTTEAAGSQPRKSDHPGTGTDIDTRETASEKLLLSEELQKTRYLDESELLEITEADDECLRKEDLTVCTKSNNEDGDGEGEEASTSVQDGSNNDNDKGTPLYDEKSPETITGGEGSIDEIDAHSHDNIQEHQSMMNAHAPESQDNTINQGPESESELLHDAPEISATTNANELNRLHTSASEAYNLIRGTQSTAPCPSEDSESGPADSHGHEEAHNAHDELLHECNEAAPAALPSPFAHEFQILDEQWHDAAEEILDSISDIISRLETLGVADYRDAATQTMPACIADVRTSAEGELGLVELPQKNVDETVGRVVATDPPPSPAASNCSEPKGEVTDAAVPEADIPVHLKQATEGVPLPRSTTPDSAHKHYDGKIASEVTDVEKHGNGMGGAQ